MTDKEETHTMNKEEINKDEDDFEEKKDRDSNINKVQFPVQVFVRIRPLVGDEIEQNHEKMEWSETIKNTTEIRTLVIENNDKKKVKSNKIKKFDGFRLILNPNDKNEKVFIECILPSLHNIFNGNTVCTFAYGHTGSGKTHTMLGYGIDNPGVYNLTCKYIFNQIDNMNKELNLLNTDNEILLEIRFAELYQDKMRDLFGNLVECFVREDDNGNIHIRGPTIKDDKTGKVKVTPLTGIYTKTSNEVIDNVTNALKYRNVGKSTLHDESSRSHAILEFELVSKNLINARINLINAESDIVPIGKARDYEYIRIQTQMYIKDPITGTYSVNSNYIEEDDTYYNNLEKEFERLSNEINICKNNIDNILNNSNKCITGTILFVDLAGNEYAQDTKLIDKETPQQIRERKEINKSLLCLKECIRGLHDKKYHVPYRNSKLTMVLRKHLKGDNSTAIMITNISSSQLHLPKTFNTLSYSQLVAQA